MFARLPPRAALNTQAHDAGADTDSVRAKFVPAWKRYTGLMLMPHGALYMPFSLKLALR